MPPLDRRVRRTRKALARAVLELAAERPFGELTIRELTAHADVGYATFFRHYATKEELLLDVLGGIVEELADLLQPSAEAGRLEAAGLALFRYVADQSDVLRVLFDGQRTGTLERDLRAAVSDRVLASPAFRPPPELPAELTAHHVAAASLALVGWWLDHGMPHPPEVMAKVYARLVVAPTRSA